MSDDDVLKVQAQKAELRDMLRRRRALAFDEDRKLGGLASRHLVDIVKAHLFNPAPHIVAGYMPIGNEIDPRPLMIHFASLGAKLVLPEVVEKEEPLRFRAWSPGDVLVSGPMGTLQPQETQNELNPDLILVPLLGFDCAGVRLGQGGGFYDRTLALARERKARIFGVAFEAQEVDVLPKEPHDQLLDGMILPSSFIIWQENRHIKYLKQN